MFQEIGSSLVACVKEENRIDEKDEDTIFCELLASQLRTFDLPDKLMIRMKISQLIYEYQMRASTAVRSDRERRTSPSNIAFTLQRPPTIQGGKIQAQNPSTTHNVFDPKDLSAVVSRFALEASILKTMFSPGHFFQQHTSCLHNLNS